LTRLLAGKYAMMNFIPFNSVEGSGFGRPSEERCWEMSQHLRRNGIIACLRDSAGQDVDGGLRAAAGQGPRQHRPARQARAAAGAAHHLS